MTLDDSRSRARPGGGLPSRRQALRILTGGVAGYALGAGQAASAGIDPGRASMPFDPALLERAVQTARAFDQIRSLTIARDGEIAFAEAFRGPPLDRPVNVKSVSKSFVAALTGVAIARGVLSGVGQSLAEIALALIPPGADPRVKELTVAHLLTMQAGLQRTSGPNYGRWVESRNWVAFALSQPFVAEPGTRMLYSTGSYHVLGALLARASGQSLLALGREWIGDTLEISIPPWMRDPQGLYLGGNNMLLSPMALLRFAEMHRLGGVWGGARVLRQSWIEQAWTPRTHSPFSGDDYGYGWFVARAGGHKMVYARGYGGQMIYIVPPLKLTVVVTSDPARPARSHGYAGQLRALLANEIIPAAG
jgi:CubicO group peptidase (beta-lactamase class C family)